MAVLRGGLGTGDASDERHNVTFQHHQTTKTLQESKKVVGCTICRALANAVEKREEIDITEDAPIDIQAELAYLKDQDSLRIDSGDRDIYRLDFTLRKQQQGFRVEHGLHTFALKPINELTSTSSIQEGKFRVILHRVSPPCLDFVVDQKCHSYRMSHAILSPSSAGSTLYVSDT